MVKKEDEYQWFNGRTILIVRMLSTTCICNSPTSRRSPIVEKLTNPFHKPRLPLSTRRHNMPCLNPNHPSNWKGKHDPKACIHQLQCKKDSVFTHNYMTTTIQSSRNLTGHQNKLVKLSSLNKQSKRECKMAGLD